MGWDSREVPAYNAARNSIITHSQEAVQVIPLVLKEL